MTTNRYKLVSGMWFRWEGDKATGGRKKYTTVDGSNLVENVTAAEVAAMGTRLELVAGKAAVEVPPIVQAAPPLKVVVTAPDPDADGEIVDIETGEVATKAVDEDERLAAWTEVVSGNLRDTVASIKVIEDLDDLEEIRKAEKKGMNRKGVFTAIKDQKAIIQGEE